MPRPGKHPRPVPRSSKADGWQTLAAQSKSQPAKPAFSQAYLPRRPTPPIRRSLLAARQKSAESLAVAGSSSRLIRSR